MHNILANNQIDRVINCKLDIQAKSEEADRDIKSNLTQNLADLQN